VLNVNAEITKTCHLNELSFLPSAEWKMINIAYGVLGKSLAWLIVTVNTVFQKVGTLNSYR